MTKLRYTIVVIINREIERLDIINEEKQLALDHQMIDDLIAENIPKNSFKSYIEDEE